MFTAKAQTRFKACVNLHTVLETKAPEKAPKDMKQPLLSNRCQRAHKTRRSFNASHKRCQRLHFTTQNSL